MYIINQYSFTGAASLKKIISHTVGVTIQADSDVEITYTAEENKEKDKTVTDNKDKDSPENKNSADKTDADKTAGSDKTADTDSRTQKNNQTDSDNHTENDNQTDSDQKTDTTTKAETDTKTKIDSGQNTGRADPYIGDYAYEENSTGMDDDDSSKSNTNHQTTSQTGENPQGVQIPGTDNVVITTDDKENLVKIDSTGNQTKIDDAHTYTLTEADDGTVKITDESGEEVVVDEDGTLTLPSGKTVTLTDDTVTTETEEESGHWFGRIVVAGIFVIFAVAVIVLYRKRKKI